MAKSNFVDLGNFVWLDSNENGVQDVGEPGIPNVTVKLLDSVSGQVRSDGETTTDANGYFHLDNVRWENAFLSFSLPTELPASLLATLESHYPASSSYYKFTQSGQGGDSSLDSNVNELGRSGRIDIADGVDSDLSYDAGVHIKPTVLSDYVWLDTNGNGQQDAGENGVGGVTVKLMQGSSELASTTSDSNGAYQLVAPQGGDYYLQFELPTEYVFSRFTEHNAAGVDDSIDSDAHRDTGKTHTVTMISGETNDTLDAGIYERDQLVSLGDKAWYDTNFNGIQDGSEAGVEGVEVRLQYADSSTMLQRTFTDANGEYQFDELLPGEYKVRFIAPRDEGYVFSPALQGGDTTLDSNVDGNGYTDVITLQSGVDDLSVDAGLTKGVGIGDYVWLDGDADGRQDADESGIAGVTVHLMQGTTEVTTTTTDADGFYYLGHDQAGTYSVKFELPSEYVFSRFTEQDAPGVDDTKDSDANRDTGETHSVTLALGERVDHIDAGIYERDQLSSLGDYVWYDADKDGVQDSSESGIEGVEVRLLDGEGDLVQRAFTDGNGKYGFEELLPGDYQVRFMAPSGQGYVFSPANQGGDAQSDSNADSNGDSGVISLPAGTTDHSIDAGMYYATSIGDFVWNDNGNGLQDAGESGINGVTVTLYQDGVSEPVATTTTVNKDGQDGYYQFDQVKGGEQYKVWFEAPDDMGFTHKDMGADSIDSDADATGYTDVFTPVVGEANDGIDAGLRQTDGTIQGYTWVDALGDAIGATKSNGQALTDADGKQIVLTEGNGLQDTGESAINDVTATLYEKVGSSWIEVSSQQTRNIDGQDGHYKFENLPHGEYKVQFTQPDGYSFTQENAGDDSIDSDAMKDDSGYYSASTTIDVVNKVSTLDAGLVEAATLGGRSFGDWRPVQRAWGLSWEEGDGIYKATDYKTNISTDVAWGDQILFQLQKWDNEAKTFQTVESEYFHSVSYAFDNLEPGAYRIKFDWNHTNSAFKNNIRANFGGREGFVIPYQNYANKDGRISGEGNDSRDNDWTRSRHQSPAKTVYSNIYTLEPGEVIDHAWNATTSPIALDLNNDGIQTVAMQDSGSVFDLLNTGVGVHSGWLSGEDAFLAIDSNQNGQIDNRDELFGGLYQGEGFSKLAAFDTNGDGQVNAQDADFDQLLLWQDANEDKVTDEGELQSLEQAGVDSLTVDYDVKPEVDAAGNLHLEHSEASLADGSSIDMVDVYFAVSAEEAQAQGVALPDMGELLSGDGILEQDMGPVMQSAVEAESVDGQSGVLTTLASALDEAALFGI